MNKIIFRKTSGLLVLIILSVLYAQAQSFNGNEAVNQLRKTGDYESLKFAFDTARSNFADEFLTPDAVIQTAVLASSDGAAFD